LDYQQTIKEPVVFSGVGLMSGVQSTLTFQPAPVDQGIVFVRVDLLQKPQVKASIANHVSDIPHCTGVRDGDAVVHTIEHLLSACCGLHIDNLTIEINAEEAPAADGSALPFVQLLNQAGIVKQNAQRKYCQIPEAISVSEGDKQLIALPDEQFRINFVYDYPGLLTQTCTFTIDETTYTEEIAAARTFCFEHEVESLRALGIGKGANDENVVIIGKDGAMDGELRYQDEMVRHKMLDLIGDLYLSGCIPRANITAIRSGHALNAKLVSAICEKVTEQTCMPPMPPIEATEIYKVLEHRYPFQLVDRVIELEEGKRCVGIKNLTINELFFQGHFPNMPVMPAVLQLEAMAQLGGYLLKRQPTLRHKLGVFAGVDKAKFRKPARPGDQLRMEVEVLKSRDKIAKVKGIATVDGERTAEAELTFFWSGWGT